jgi:hypothetical protein
MVAILKSGESKKNMQKLMEQLSKKKSSKSFDAKKFCGVLKLKKDPLVLQKELRNEWK